MKQYFSIVNACDMRLLDVCMDVVNLSYWQRHSYAGSFFLRKRTLGH
jgi:hypothetical protein